MASVRDNEGRGRVARRIAVEIPENDASVARASRRASSFGVERERGDVAVVLVGVVNGLSLAEISFDERAIPSGGEKTRLVDERAGCDPAPMLAKRNGGHGH